MASLSNGRLCEQCLREFTPLRTDAIYCSCACRQRAYRERATTRRHLNALKAKHNNDPVAIFAELEKGIRNIMVPPPVTDEDDVSRNGRTTT